MFIIAYIRLSLTFLYMAIVSVYTALGFFASGKEALIELLITLKKFTLRPHYHLLIIGHLTLHFHIRY